MTDGTSEKMISAANEINWQIEDRPKNKKNSEWLWALAIIGFSVIVFSIILKNYLLIIIIALAIFIFYASKNKEPEQHYFKLNNEGLYINGKLFHYDSFESFWIFPDKEIAFRRKHNFMPLLIIPFDSNEESQIEKVVSSHLPEVEEEASFLDLLQKNIF